MKHGDLPSFFRAAIASVALVALGAILFGCDLWGASVSVVCTLPRTPLHWAEAWGEPSYTLRVITAPGASEEHEVPVGVGQIALELPKEVLALVVARPRWDSGPGLAPGESMHPAGSVWPHAAARSDTTSTRLALTYEMGFVAEVMGSAILLSRVAATFNVTRLIAEVAARAGPDPWQVDARRLIAAISGGRMRADYIRPQPTVPCTVDLPPGSWYAPSPFHEPVAGGGVTLDLPEGTSTLYDCSGRRALFQVDEEERCWWSLTVP